VLGLRRNRRSASSCAIESMCPRINSRRSSGIGSLAIPVLKTFVRDSKWRCHSGTSTGAAGKLNPGLAVWLREGGQTYKETHGEAYEGSPESRNTEARPPSQ
jgi:hypothetical protein